MFCLFFYIWFEWIYLLLLQEKKYSNYLDETINVGVAVANCICPFALTILNNCWGCCCVWICGLELCITAIWGVGGLNINWTPCGAFCWSITGIWFNNNGWFRFPGKIIGDACGDGWFCCVVVEIDGLPTKVKSFLWWETSLTVGYYSNAYDL